MGVLVERRGGRAAPGHKKGKKCAAGKVIVYGSVDVGVLVRG